MENLRIYSSLLSDINYLKGTGILSDERLQEIANHLNKSNFIPAELKDGRTLTNWVLHKTDGHIFHKDAIEKTFYLIGTQLLERFLTQEEIIKLNKKSDFVYKTAREEKLFKDAVKVQAKNYCGSVYHELLSWNEGYASDVDEFLDFWNEDNDYLGEGPYPNYVWACHTYPICELDYDRIIEGATQDSYTEYFDVNNDLLGRAELEEAIKKFNELNKNKIYWIPNYKLAILL